jgi:threonine/homoserine/homoserine lactone efflux protein
MRFNPRALVVFLAVCVVFALAASSNSSWVHAAEAATTVVIVLNLVRLLRERRRTG